jgi:hypothetical protein
MSVFGFCPTCGAAGSSRDKRPFGNDRCANGHEYPSAAALPAKRYDTYQHHGATVTVRSDLKGKHRDHCLCWSCDKMKPAQPDHCPIAAKLYAVCVEHNLVTPVYECPDFAVKA